MTAALALLVVSATLVAVTVTICWVAMVLGAVYRPALDSVPTEGLIDQVTAVFDEPVTVAANCCVWLALRLADAGLTWTLTPEAPIISMALTLGRSTEPARN